MTTPWMELHDDYFSFKVKKHAYTPNLDFFCDNGFEHRSNPKAIETASVNKYLDVYREQGNIFYPHQRLLWLNFMTCGHHNDDMDWCYWNAFMCLHPSLVVHIATSYIAYEDHCRQLYPDLPQLDIQKCATAYALHRNDHEFNDYSSMGYNTNSIRRDNFAPSMQDDYLFSLHLKSYSIFLCDHLLTIALLLYLLRINFGWTTLQVSVVVINIVSSIMILPQPTLSMGTDF